MGALSAHMRAPVSATGDERDGTTSFRIAAAGTPALVAALTEWLAARALTLDDLRTGGPSLEEVFLHLTSPPREGDR